MIENGHVLELTWAGRVSEADRWAEFRGLRLIPSRIPSSDALVSFVATGQPIHPAVQRTIDRAGCARWYPVPGGHEVLVPHEGGPYDRREFKVRTKAWDHETCSGCRGNVAAMTPCWVTEEGPFKLLCSRCKAQMDAGGDEGA
jgi:hypothetical protein